MKKLSQKFLRGFISYSTYDKEHAARVKEALSGLAVECFVAHDDLDLSEAWKQRILKELKEAHVFIPLLSQYFKQSDWAPQELGFAVTRPELLIIPISVDGTLPFGFISHLQGKRLPEPLTSQFFIAPLAEKFPRHVIPPLIDELSGAVSFRDAEALMEPLTPLFERFTDEEIDGFVGACVSNGQIWLANKCYKEYLPHFIRLHQKRIDPDKLKALAYQLEEGAWYRGEQERRPIVTGA